MESQEIRLNNKTYRCPENPLVVVCIDGGDPEYVEHGLSAGIIPVTKDFIENGFYSVARGSMPSFTCPNNMSIVTGTEPEVHGISGNFFLDPETGEPVVMTGPELLRARSIMSEFSRQGVKVASVTSKDKLRQQLQKDMDLSNGSVSFSAQHADECTMAENGIENVIEFVGQPKPDMYSAELSLFVLDAGIRLLEDRAPKILYLSLTDFIQHSHAPGDPIANKFYSDMDARFARMVELGATVALTADHGMGDKADADGAPMVIWLQDVLDAAVGEGRMLFLKLFRKSKVSRNAGWAKTSPKSLSNHSTERVISLSLAIRKPLSGDGRSIMIFLRSRVIGFAHTVACMRRPCRSFCQSHSIQSTRPKRRTDYAATTSLNLRLTALCE